MAATTAEGEIIIVEENEQKQVIDNAFGTDEIYNVTAIREFSKGFIVASDKGHMAMWVRAEENNQSTNKEGQLFDFVRSWKLFKNESQPNTPVISIDISPQQEEYIAAACANNNIYLTNYKSIGFNEGMDKEVKVDQVSKGFHSGPITAMDVAVQRPLIVTCSREDSTIRIWNYYKFTCEQARIITTMDESAMSKQVKPLLTVAMHPSGYYMAAGFMDKIRIYHILHDSIKTFRNVEIKHCNRIKFSNGGQYFVAVDQRHVYMYHSYTLKRLGGKEQIQSTQISDIVWNQDDTCVALVALDGYIYRFKTVGGLQKLNEGVISDRQTMFNGVQFTADPGDEY